MCYARSSRRCQLIDSEIERPFLERLARLEKTGLEFRPTYEGYIVNLEGQPRNKPIEIDAQPERAKITVLTARDFYNADATEFSWLPSRSQVIAEASPIHIEDKEWIDNEVEQNTNSDGKPPSHYVEDCNVSTPPTEKLSAESIHIH